jgi:formylglycine-generating enzyme required for sulfatase activity
MSLGLLLVISACQPAPEPPPPSETSPAVTGWKNSLGMVFRPVPDRSAKMSIWETRVRDFAAFVDATGHDAREQYFYYDGKYWQSDDHYWRDPGFFQTEDHPVIGVSWMDAAAFCRWLTEHERELGVVTPKQAYRLPSEAEWVAAVGTNSFNAPPRGSANYHSNLQIDPYEYTSAVGIFPANEFGFHDLAGNVWEYGQEKGAIRERFRIIRGGSWQNWHSQYVGVQAKGQCGETVRLALYGFRVVLVDEDELYHAMIQEAFPDKPEETMP